MNSSPPQERCGWTDPFFRQCLLLADDHKIHTFVFVNTGEGKKVSYSVWLDFDKPLTSLVYPPSGKKVSQDCIRLGTLPCYYTVGEMSSRPLMFPTKREAEQVANLIPSSVIQKDAND
jgi:hypothetical protein